MDGDEIFKRFWQSILIVVVLWLLLYFMIIETQKYPTAYALAIVQITEKVFHWLKITAIISTVCGGTIFLMIHVHKEREKEIQRLENERQKTEGLDLRKQLEIEGVRQEELKLEQQTIANELRQQEINQLRMEKENYLKKRSAEEANKDALKHFM